MAPLPPGFQLEKRAGGAPLPPGFQLERPAAAPAAAPVVTSPMDALDVLDRQAVADVTGVMPTPEEMPALQQPPQREMRAPKDDPMRALDIGFQGMRRGVASIPGFVVDITNALMNLGLMGADAIIPGDQSQMRMSDRPFGGTEFNTDLIESIVPGEPFTYEEMTPAQRVGYEANNFGTAAFLPATTLAAPVVRTAAQTMKSPMLEGLTRPYTRGVTPVSDAVAGAGAGGTLGWYETSVPEDIQEKLGPFGDILTMLAGATGANMIEGLTQAAIRGATGTAKRVVTGGVDTNLPLNEDGSFVRAQDADAAALYTQGMASNPEVAASRVAERQATLRPFAESPDAIPTSGALSDDPGLIAAERAARQDPALFKRFAGSDQATERAALDNARRVAPEDARGRDFTDTIEQRHDQRVDVANRRIGWTEQHQAGVAGRQAAAAGDLAANRGGKTAASVALDEPVTTRLTADQQRKNEAFDAIDPTGTEFRDPSELLRVVDEIETGMGALNDPSGAPQALMQRIRGLIAPDGTITQVSFRDMQTLRPELAGQIAAARKAGNYTLADNLTRLKGVLDTEAERLAAQGGEAGARAQEALRVYKDEFAPTWARGPGSEAQRFRQDFNKDRFGRTTTPPSETAGRFIQPGQPEKLADLRRIVGDDERGQRAAGDFLLADLAEAGAIRNNAIDPAAVRRWMQKWGDDAINLSPQFRRQLDDLLKSADVDAADATVLGRQLKEATEQLAEAQRDTDAVRAVLGKDPVKAVAGIFSSADPERTVQGLMGEIGGNESARNGLKAAVREYLMERATTSGISKTGTAENPLSFAKLDEVFKQHENVLADIFTPEEMNFLRASHQFLAPLKNLEMKTLPGSQTSPNERLWAQLAKPLEVGLKFRFGVLKGGGIMRTISLWRQMLPNGDEAARTLIARMWFDPDLARHLLTRNVSEVGSSRWNGKLIRLLAYGQGARDLVENREK